MVSSIDISESDIDNLLILLTIMISHLFMLSYDSSEHLVFFSVTTPSASLLPWSISSTMRSSMEWEEAGGRREGEEEEG